MPGSPRAGHQVSILGWQTKQAHDWNGCRVHAVGTDPMGSDALYAYLIRHRPDIVIALADVWWLPYFGSPHVRRQMELTGTPWALYFPVTGTRGRAAAAELGRAAAHGRPARSR